MDEIQDPGAPRTDELARNAAFHALWDTIRGNVNDPVGDGESAAEAVAREHAVTWERDINSAGVAVRRYVLRGAWEVDPEAVTP